MELLLNKLDELRADLRAEIRAEIAPISSEIKSLSSAITDLTNSNLGLIKDIQEVKESVQHNAAKIAGLEHDTSNISDKLTNAQQNLDSLSSSIDDNNLFYKTKLDMMESRNRNCSLKLFGVMLNDQQRQDQYQLADTIYQLLVVPACKAKNIQPPGWRQCIEWIHPLQIRKQVTAVPLDVPTTTTPAPGSYSAVAAANKPNGKTNTIIQLRMTSRHWVRIIWENRVSSLSPFNQGNTPIVYLVRDTTPAVRAATAFLRGLQEVDSKRVWVGENGVISFHRANAKPGDPPVRCPSYLARPLCNMLRPLQEPK